ncbi:hypothetical protein AUJ95_04835 [Candidatus Desantisbacteria bacterium CG2_30_40_21]|uniref:Uncharacterized protein n=2 Tax=unclassified Candidatus Desantisiibacteriota TaxID=3106372 RepID=A0A2H0AA40_9BACT|nr:MAG: hypothetical protein AUJ95_04835 [Candidatus Desantisbacteria bacterium CG2_30_40_21]PIP41388.1 MAG: hypothetical protein COX18_03440 [Candidatus Desantisbacteria bacterium CG23_combo_of_CG06-09_8_20_14_all_40_23]
MEAEEFSTLLVRREIALIAELSLVLSFVSTYDIFHQISLVFSLAHLSVSISLTCIKVNQFIGHSATTHYDIFSPQRRKGHRENAENTG